MKKLKFKPKDFAGNFDLVDLEVASDCAQAVFDEWFKENIENASVVYGRKVKCLDRNEYVLDGKWLDYAGKGDTHSAKLIDVKELK